MDAFSTLLLVVISRIRDASPSELRVHSLQASHARGCAARMFVVASWWSWSLVSCRAEGRLVAARHRTWLTSFAPHGPVHATPLTHPPLQIPSVPGHSPISLRCVHSAYSCVVVLGWRVLIDARERWRSVEVMVSACSVVRYLVVSAWWWGWRWWWICLID